MNIESLSKIDGYAEAVDNWFQFVTFLVNNDIAFNVLFFNESRLNDYNFDALMNSHRHIIFYSEVD